MSTEKSVENFINKVNENDEDFINNNNCYHFYDWFCKDESLKGKFKTLFPKVKRLAKSSKINTSTMYVWFKNNCPCNGPLYDDIRFSDIETGDVVYTIIPKCGHTGNAEVWGRENDFAYALVSGTWNDVKEFFKDDTIKTKIKSLKII